MAKKPTKWLDSALDHPDDFLRPKSTEPNEYLKALTILRLDGDERDFVENTRVYYAKVLSPYAKRDKKSKYLLNLGDGWHPYSFFDVPADMVGVLCDAVLGMDLAYLCQHLPKGKRISTDNTKFIQSVFLAGFVRGAIRHYQVNADYLNKGVAIDLARRSGKGKLSDEEKAKAIVEYQKAKDESATDNAAVLRVAKLINADRNNPVKPDTIRRTLGLRK